MEQQISQRELLDIARAFRKICDKHGCLIVLNRMMPETLDQVDAMNVAPLVRIAGGVVIEQQREVVIKSHIAKHVFESIVTETYELLRGRVSRQPISRNKMRDIREYLEDFLLSQGYALLPE